MSLAYASSACVITRRYPTEHPRLEVALDHGSKLREK